MNGMTMRGLRVKEHELAKEKNKAMTDISEVKRRGKVRRRIGDNILFYSRTPENRKTNRHRFYV